MSCVIEYFSYTTYVVIEGNAFELIDKCTMHIHHKTDKLQDKFEDTKGVIRIHKSKKGRQHNDQKKKDKGTNNDLQNIRTKPKID